MLNADSSTLNSERRPEQDAPPIRPRVAFRRILSTHDDAGADALGNTFLQLLDEVARLGRPAAEPEQGRRGRLRTNESNASTRSSPPGVPRSAKNFENVSRICTVLAFAVDGAQALSDLTEISS
jgi:hypothetical protein